MGAGKAARDDVVYAKVGAFANGNVLAVLVLGQHVVALARAQEVYLLDLVALVEDELLRRDDVHLEHGTDPADEGLRLVLEEVHLHVDLLVDVDRQLSLEVVRQLLDEFVNTSQVLGVIKLEVLLDV